MLESSVDGIAAMVMDSTEAIIVFFKQRTAASRDILIQLSISGLPRYHEEDII